MNQLIVVPILLPAIVAALSLLGRRAGRSIGAGFSLLGCAGVVAVSVALLLRAQAGEVQVYAMGDWPAPFGIVLVLDRLSALMLVITSLLALIVLCHAVLTGLDRRGWHFHPLFQFQLLGLNGAFLTGDLFNLFVFFEVLLIASYGLMFHGQGAERLKAGVHYVVVNLIGSTLFLIGVGLLYGVTGTLNMADMGGRLSQLPAGDQGLARAGALVLVAVFALKAALLPLHLWLPRAYAATSPAVAALFAIMTKVGVYAIIRTVTLIFGADAGAVAWAPAPWMLPAALLTIVGGYLGVLAARGLRDQAAFAVLGSTGTLLAAVSLFEPRAMAAALYYLPHSVFAGALLFLVADLVARRRPGTEDAIATDPRFAHIEPVSALYLLAAIAIVGMPPLSGFIGKLLILASSIAHPAAGWIWAAILATTLIGMIGFARAGSTLFWKSAASPEPRIAAPAHVERAELLPAAALVLLLAGLVVAAGPVTGYMGALSEQLFAPRIAADSPLVPGREG